MTIDRDQIGAYAMVGLMLVGKLIIVTAANARDLAERTWDAASDRILGRL